MRSPSHLPASHGEINKEDSVFSLLSLYLSSQLERGQEATTTSSPPSYYYYPKRSSAHSKGFLNTIQTAEIKRTVVLGSHSQHHFLGNRIAGFLPGSLLKAYHLSMHTEWNGFNHSNHFMPSKVWNKWPLISSVEDTRLWVKLPCRMSLLYIA